MYHPDVISATVAKLENHYRPSQPLRDYTVSEVESWTERLSDAVDRKGRRTRPLSIEEQRFIVNELILTKASYSYWAERHCYINYLGAGVERLYPLWDSQRLILDEVAKLEKACFDGEREDGIFIGCLKARQLGCSTWAQSALGHRLTTQSNIHALMASDIPGPEGSGYFFGMLELIVERLPWFLRPRVVEHTKNEEMVFDTGSRVLVGAGKSMKGVSEKRGQLGRGLTLSLLHLSELSTWEAPGQIDDALMPTVHVSPRALAIFESTGKGRNNWWHRHWNKTVGGLTRFVPVFIPWYAEPSKYRKRPPVDWSPSATTQAHARRCEETGERWIHKPVRLTRDQLYWYETTRAEFEADDNLSAFLEEYAADPEEAFQYSGHSIFSVTLQQRVKDQARPVAGVLEILPTRAMQLEGLR